MRDVLLTLFIFGTLPFILRRPFFGILVWSWLSYMNPHKLAWGFAVYFPFAQIVAITLFVALIFCKERKRIPINGLTVTWIIFMLWMAVTTIMALYVDSAQVQLTKIYKIQLITFLSMLLINSQKRIDLLIWVIVGSIGFFSFKGGIFTLLTGGAYRVWGPAQSYIEENNALAVATLMIVPLMFYLRHITTDKRFKLFWLVAIALSLVSVIGSQSRGALIAILAVGFFFWLKSSSKLVSGLMIIILGVSVYSFAPANWHERMGTIVDYQNDGSAMGRINSWQYSINVASDRLTGGGLESWEAGSFAIWAPVPDDVHAAHSIYFSMLGDHGWPGLFMFLLILWLCWRYLGNVIKVTRNRPELANQNFLARMLQVSLVAYMSGGAFLSLAYFDLPWHLIAIAVLLRTQILELQRDTIPLSAQSSSQRIGTATRTQQTPTEHLG